MVNLKKLWIKSSWINQLRNIARPIHFVSRFIDDVLAPNTDDMFEKNLSGYLSPELKPVAVIRFGFFDIHISLTDGQCFGCMD